MTIEAPLFSDLTRRRSRLPVRIILLAILLHLLLLGIPAGKKPVPPATLEVALQFEPLIIESLPEQQAIPPVPVEPAATAEPAITPETITTSEPTGPSESLQETVSQAEETPVPELVREQLLQAVASMDWAVPDTEPGLARSTSSETLGQLYRPILPALADNSFNGMTAPSEAQVMDRWMDPNGTQQVVIRSPDGNTYCGRQAAMDPFRPWLQMPMLFHACGGGGKRSGKQSWLNN